MSSLPSSLPSVPTIVPTIVLVIRAQKSPANGWALSTIANFLARAVVGRSVFERLTFGREATVFFFGNR